MHKFVIVAALVVLPAAGHAQSAVGTGENASTAAAAGQGTYGPPAPVVRPTGSGAPAARAASPSTEGTSTPARHRGRRRGSYIGADAGGIPR